MRALLDTNAFLWFISGSGRLSETARNAIADINNDLVLSIASLWEIAIKTSLGKLQLAISFDRLIHDQIEQNAIDVLPIHADHLTTIISLKFHHRDPFDRLIIAQGMTENIPVITSDAQFSNYPVDVIW